jgi:DNA-binding transcriptional MocR family regulator
MAIDRNMRARLGAKLRADTALTHATRLVGNASLFATMDAKTGRAQASRARLAHEAGCAVRTVTRATNALEEAGYIKVIPTYGPRKRVSENGKRWYRPRGANVIEWVVPEDFLLSDKRSAYPSTLYNKSAPAALDPGLSSALARLGHSIADKAGLPREVSPI